MTVTGYIYNINVYYNIGNIGASPASNLNLGSVLFTSASGASKTSALAKTAASTDNTWKTTLKDTTKTIKTNGTVTRSGQTVSVPYTYTGSDVDQVSIVITDGDITSSDSSALYYGKLDGATSASGTGTFTMPSGLPSGYKAYVLAEDVNEWMYTDYASSPVEISIPAQTGETVVADKYSITTSVTGGKIDESITGITKGDNKTINYSSSKGYKLKSITIDGKKVDITKYPSSYTFSDIAANHDIKVVYEKESTTTVISTSPKGLGPKTGDQSEIPFWILLGGTVAAFAVILVKKRKDEAK